MERVCKFLKDASVYYLATVEDDQPRVRIAGELIEDDRVEARASMLDAYPSLRKMYDENDGNTQVFYMKNATATFCSFGKAPEFVEF